LFTEHIFASAPKLDAQGLIRMDEHELADAVQAELRERFAALAPGDAFDLSLYERFMAAYARTRGFGVPGVDYANAFDTEDVC
jgi:enoyl-[acyl-carrier protein] reductase/trans-2-enoyl-CoA reductase (NAD+)